VAVTKKQQSQETVEGQESVQLTLPAAADKITWQLFTADMRLAGETQATSASHLSYTQTADLGAGVYLVRPLKPILWELEEPWV